MTRSRDSVSSDLAKDYEEKRTELISLLLRKKVPAKEEILRAKALIRDLVDRPGIDRDGAKDENGFMSAYLDLYLGRMTGEASIEKVGLRRCLDYLGAFDETCGTLERRRVKPRSA